MYKITTKQEEPFLVETFDGGGCLIGSRDYDVVFQLPDGSYGEVKQAQIVSVIDQETGEPYTEFGNIYFPGHPYPEED